MVKAKRKIAGWCFECEVGMVEFVTTKDFEIRVEATLFGITKNKIHLYGTDGKGECCCGKGCKAVKVELELRVKKLTK